MKTKSDHCVSGIQIFVFWKKSSPALKLFSLSRIKELVKIRNGGFLIYKSGLDWSAAWCSCGCSFRENLLTNVNSCWRNLDWLSKHLHQVLSKVVSALDLEGSFWARWWVLEAILVILVGEIGLVVLKSPQRLVKVFTLDYILLEESLWTWC